jgi:hypothetical protein
MRNARLRVPATDIHYLLSKDHRIDHAIAPERLGNRRMSPTDASQCCVRHPEDGCSAQRLERGSRSGLHDRRKVRHVASDIECGNLAISERVLIEAGDQTGNDQTGMIDLVTELHEVSVGLDLLYMRGQVEYRTPLGFRELGPACQPVEE